jgi:peptidoglycan/xylan/chitin deacetylase (PgdA/CDA1 family)
VVVPIAFHSIVEDGTTIIDPWNVSAQTFLDFVNYAHYLGYETITTSQLSDFLYNNALIPPKSMILIFDDHREGVILQHVAPIWDEFNLKVTMAYISGPSTKDYEWTEMEQLASTKRMDVQAHGWLHNADTYITDQTPEDVIRQEIFKPIPVLQKHFGYRPTAFIWPGGNFTPLAVSIAREAGYTLGFADKSRGPLLFNWIPLEKQGIDTTDNYDKQEQAVNDPLMILPRFWSSEASLALDLGIKAGEEAGAYAQKNYKKEANWYRAECGGELPPMPTALPTQ